MKSFTIITTRRGGANNLSRNKEVTGDMEYLTDYFSYTLECGKAYEHEKGNKKINLKPKSGKALVTALNNAASNSAANGDPSTYYSLKEN